MNQCTLPITLEGEPKPPVACENFLGFGAEWDSRAYRRSGITDEDFALIRRRVEWMRFPVARIMMRINWCLVDETQFDFETEPMQDLYRHLDLCEQLGTHVFLTDWGCMPDWLRAPGIQDVADPRYAECIGIYLDHLIRQRGYRCIRSIIMVNEPNFEVKDFALWHQGLKNLRTVLRERGLDRDLTVAGCDEAHRDNWHRQTVDEAASLIDIYDVHHYAKGERVRSGEFEAYVRDLWTYVRKHDPAGASKPCIIGEAGLDDNAKHPYGSPHIDTFDYGLFMADYAVQAARAGSAAVLAWMLDDNSHPDFFWGMWSHKKEGLRLRPWAYPWMLLGRLIPAGSTLYAPSSKHPDVRFLLAAKAGSATLIAVNRGDSPAPVVLECKGTSSPKLTLYAYDEGTRQTDAEGLPTPLRVDFPTDSRFEINLPGSSMYALTLEAQ